MDSLSRGALIHGHGITFTPSNATRTTTTTTTSLPPSNLHFSSTNSRAKFCVRASSNSNRNGEIIQKIRTTAATLIFTAATALMIGKLSELPARAESPVPIIQELVVEEEEEQQQQQREEEEQQKEEKLEQEKKKESPLTEFLESSSQAIDALKSLLQEKLELGEDEEALTILKRLSSAQPSELQWKFMMGRVLNELGEKQEARKVFEEILEVNPLSFEALFHNALLMDQCGEGEAVLGRLEEALKLAEQEEKDNEARDVRFIMAQVHYLQKNIDEALKSYQELEKEDPKDYRPYFARGVIYSLLDRNAEAKEQFAKCHELSPAKFKVQGFVQTPLSRTELFTKESDS